MIPIAKPVLGEPEAQAARRAIMSGWITQGPEVAAFEKAFADYVGAPHACAVSNCTTALHLTLLVAGVSPGDEVVTVSHSYIATANCIRYCGATPVFVDIDPATFNMDPALIEAAITERTKAILCVHQIGMPCDLQAISAVARRHQLPLIEDAACAIGSEILWDGHWEKIGRPHADAACFSLHPRKIITTGDGGMITTARPEWDQRLRLLRQHAMSVPDTVRHGSQQVIFESYPELGFNYRMTDIQAAVGCEQLKRLPEILQSRRVLADEYKTLLSDIPGLTLPHEPEWARTNWQSYCVGLPSWCDQRTVMQALLDAGVSTRRGIMCSHREPAYQSAPLRHPLPCSEQAQDHHILLPLFAGMTRQDQEVVAQALRQACARPHRPDQPEKKTAHSHTYREILKATALIGGSSMLNIVIGMLRNKIMAILLGPAGIGLTGLYGSIADLIRSVAQLGVNSSGVREIAAATGSQDQDRIALTATVLRRVSLILGLIGASLLLATSQAMSTWTFGTPDHTGSVALLSMAVLFRIVSDSECALIQGMRHIADYAKVAFFGALLGTVASVALVYLYGVDGVAPSLVAVAALGALTSWWYSRKIRLPRAAVPWREVGKQAQSLLALGMAFMASGVLMMAGAYLNRLIVLRHDGLDAAGFYQVAWTLGGLYVTFVLQAMGADFYPRLVTVNQDNSKSTHLVNEQTQVSLLLAGPGVIATLTLAPVVVSLFYSPAFAAAVDTLRWVCLGMMLRVITWPMGFILVAKGNQRLFFLTELAWAVFNVGLTWILVELFGHRGAGMAFFASYLFHGLMLYPIVRNLSDFHWTAETRNTGMVFLSGVALVFCGFQALPLIWAMTLGVLMSLVSAVFSLRTLMHLVNPGQLPGPLRKMLPLFRFGRWRAAHE